MKTPLEPEHLTAPDDLAVRLRLLMRSKGSRWLKRRTGFGPCHGACLLFAQALQMLLPGSKVVTLVRSEYHGDYAIQPEHYGVLWQGWYFDGLGGFPDGDQWTAEFGRALDCDLIVVDRFVPTPEIPQGTPFRAMVANYLRERLAG